MRRLPPITSGKIGARPAGVPYAVIVCVGRPKDSGELQALVPDAEPLFECYPDPAELAH